MKRDIKADREMCEKATPGPYRSWPQMGDGHALVERVFRDEQDRRCHQFLAVCGSVGVDNSANAVLFAESREALPHYIDRTEKAEERLEKAEGLLLILHALFCDCRICSGKSVTCKECGKISKQVKDFLGIEPCAE